MFSCSCLLLFFVLFCCCFFSFFSFCFCFQAGDMLFLTRPTTLYEHINQDTRSTSRCMVSAYRFAVLWPETGLAHSFFTATVMTLSRDLWRTFTVHLLWTKRYPSQWNTRLALKCINSAVLGSASQRANLSKWPTPLPRLSVKSGAGKERTRMSVSASQIRSSSGRRREWMWMPRK